MIFDGQACTQLLQRMHSPVKRSSGTAPGGRSSVSLLRYRAAPVRRAQTASSAPADPAKNTRRATWKLCADALLRASGAKAPWILTSFTSELKLRPPKNRSRNLRAGTLASIRIQSALRIENSMSWNPLRGQMRTHQSMPKTRVAATRVPRPRLTRITDIVFVALFTAKGLLKMHRGSIHSSTGYPATAPTNVSIATYRPTGGHLLHQLALRKPACETFSSRKTSRAEVQAEPPLLERTRDGYDERKNYPETDGARGDT